MLGSRLTDSEEVQFGCTCYIKAVKFMYFCVEKLILNDREIYALEDVLSKGT
jgi:hypothetical protein